MTKIRSANLLRYFTYVSTGVAMLFATAATTLSYDKGTNYFAANSGLFSVAAIFAFLAFALAVAAAWVTPKQEISASSPFGASPLLALPSTMGLCAGAILLLFESAASESPLPLITAVLLISSAIYSMLTETAYSSKQFVILLGLTPALACALMIGVLYFDLSMEMNAPLKVVTQCALLPLMLYFTAELRYSLNRAIPRLYLALALGSVAAASMCALAIPVACLTGTLENINCLAASLIVVGTNITILLKLKRYLQPIPAPENDTKETDAQ